MASSYRRDTWRCDEVSKVTDRVFADCYYHRPDLISRVTNFGTSSPENAAKIGLYGESVKILRVFGKQNNEEAPERTLVLRGAQLNSLTSFVVLPRAAGFIANCCNQLSKLKLNTISPFNPKRASLELILPKVGKTLRKLTIIFMLSRNYLRVIRSHCANLNSLNLSLFDGESHALASLFASYGENLQHIYLPSSLSVENIWTVLSSCPNLKLSVIAVYPSAAFIDVVSDRVTELEIYLDYYQVPPGCAQDIFSSCTVLHKLNSHANRSTYVQSIWRDLNFEYPFTNHSSIRTLHIDYLLTPFNLCLLRRTSVHLRESRNRRF